MGDVQPQAVSPNEYAGQETPAGAPDTVADVQPGFAPQFQHYGQQAFSSQFDMAQPQGPARAGPYNMNAMMGALPQANYRQGQRFNPAAASPAVVQPVSQYPGQPLPNQQYFVPQNAHMPQYFAAPLSPSHPQHAQQQQQQQQQQQHQQQQQQQQQGNLSPRSNMAYYPAQVPFVNPQAAHPSGAYYYPQSTVFPAQGQAMQGQMLAAQYASPTPPHVDSRHPPYQAGDQSGNSFPQPQESGRPGDSRSNVVRGPPRKPKQSGHAIWIGNLPPQTDLMSLVHHVCREASALESLFLISKSNCAFANFKDEQSCVAAQQKLHDSKFQSVRLVSRLRKSTVEGASGVTAPTGPAASATQPQAPATDGARESLEETETKPEPTPAAEPKAVSGDASTPQKDKFFILKSLTVEDLERSVRTGIWATQSHNEEALNIAFKSADSVFLVFSANKSGEYFGYAKMTSPINEDPAAAIEFAPKAQTASDVDLPKAIPTEATEFAPRGRIIDDSARGTIFWEAEQDENSAEASTTGSEGGSTGDVDDAVSAKSGQDAEGGESKAWGKPFKLEWLSTVRLPFYRTRGLRNPWNSNREVKIARDGTELEPSVGRRLIGLFNRVQSPAPIPLITGYPPYGQ